MKGKLVVTAAPNTVREESGCSEPNEDNKRRDDDRDDNMDAKDDQPHQKQQGNLIQRKYTAYNPDCTLIIYTCILTPAPSPISASIKNMLNPATQDAPVTMLTPTMRNLMMISPTEKMKSPWLRFCQPQQQDETPPMTGQVVAGMGSVAILINMFQRFIIYAVLCGQWSIFYCHSPSFDYKIQTILALEGKIMVWNVFSHFELKMLDDFLLSLKYHFFKYYYCIRF